MITQEEVTASTLELWAQYHTVGPKGYVDSDGESIDEPTVEAAETICNQSGQLHGISWVNFSIFYGPDEKFARVGESLLATSQKRLRALTFEPVSAIIESGQLPKHTAKWLGYLVTKPGDSDRRERPDRFDELIKLL